MNIRTATVNDAVTLLNIYKPSVVKTAISFEYDVPTLEEFESRIRNTLKMYPYIVAEDNGEIVGYAYASIFHGREAYRHCVELSLYVKENKRGLGIGSRLYNEIELILRKQNVFVLYACIASTDRVDDEYVTDASIMFHEKAGFKLDGRHVKCGYKHGRWYDVVWMSKRLEEAVDNPPEFVPFSKISSSGR